MGICPQKCNISPQKKGKKLKINKFYRNPFEKLYGKKSVSAENFAIIVSENFPYQ